MESERESKPSFLRRNWSYLALAAVVGVFVLWYFSPGQKVDRWIDQLHSDNHKTQREYLDYLRRHDDRKLVNERLLRAVQDDDRAWSVRRMCAGELVRRERTNDLERLLREGELTTRTVVMDTFADKEYFRRTLAPDKTYRVYETLDAWLRDASNSHRARAIQIVKRLDWKEALPLIRPLLQRSGRPNVSADTERMTLEAAASAVQHFEDCESVPALMALARSDPSSRVRMRTMQEVHRLVFERDVCPGAVEEAEMKELVKQRLDDADHAARMAAMIIYKLQPAWAGEVAASLREVLADLTRGSGERRLALEVLVAIEDALLLEELPRWFYDVAPEVRSSAAQSVRKYKQGKNPFLGSLIGLVRNERDSKSAFDAAAQTLRDEAGRWQGIPDEMAAKANKPAGRREFQQVLNGLFASGEAQGVRRETFARGWFVWHAQHLGLTGDDLAAAVVVYDRFWKAADDRDLAAARNALREDTFDKPRLSLAIPICEAGSPPTTPLPPASSLPHHTPPGDGGCVRHKPITFDDAGPRGARPARIDRWKRAYFMRWGSGQRTRTCLVSWRRRPNQSRALLRARNSRSNSLSSSKVRAGALNSRRYKCTSDSVSWVRDTSLSRRSFT